MVVVGAVIGGFPSSRYLSDNTVEINPQVARQLSQDYGIVSAGQAYLPLSCSHPNSLATRLYLLF